MSLFDDVRIAQSHEADLALLLEELSVRQSELDTRNRQLLATQAELTRICHKYEHLYNNAPVGYLSTTTSGQIIEINRVGARFLGTESSRILGVNLMVIAIPEHQEMLRDFLAKLLTTDSQVETRIRLRQTSGDTIPVTLRGSRHPLAEGEGVEFRIALLDVSEANAREMEAQFLSTAIHHSRAFLALVSQTGQVRFASQAILDLLGKDRNDTWTLGSILNHLVFPNNHELILSEIQKKESLGLPWEGDVLVQDIAGKRRWLGVSIQRVPLLRNDLAMDYLVVAQDVTALKSQTGLEESRRRNAEAASRAKTTFLARMSHDLRTPLTTALGYAELLARSSIGDTAQAQARRIVESGESLLSLLNDILDLAKIESGKLDFVSERFSLLKMLESLRDEMTFVCKNKAVSFELIHDIFEDLLVDGDRVRVAQILRNLLSNAVKATERGFIRLAFSHSPDWISIRISDTGCGIDEGKLQSIFNAYEQEKSHNSYDRRGVGLGLAIVKQLVEAIGGSIQASSQLGRGTTFEVTLPLPTQEVQKSEEMESRVLQQPREGLRTTSQVRVLVVDDNVANALLIQEIIGTTVDSCEIAHDGLAAMEILEHSEGFDLLFLDIEMPRLDGIETLQRIRVHPKFSTIPVIALTAHALAGDRERFLAIGFDDVLTKPIDFNKIFHKVEQVRHRTQENKAMR